MLTPRFHPGQVLKAEDLNKIVDLVTARISVGPGIRRESGLNRLGLSLDLPRLRELTRGPGGGTMIRIFRAKTEHEDYVECLPYDPVADKDGPVNIAVAKPYESRGTSGYYEEDQVVIAGKMPTGIVVEGEGEEADDSVVWQDMTATPASLVPFRITWSTQDGDNKKWTYTGRKQRSKIAAGYAGWPDDPDDETEYDLYNLSEINNGSSGTYGNGITQDHLDKINGVDSNGDALEGVETPGTVDLRPIAHNATVLCTRVVVGDGEGGTVEEYWFDRPNAVYGDCPEYEE